MIWHFNDIEVSIGNMQCFEHYIECFIHSKIDSFLFSYASSSPLLISIINCFVNIMYPCLLSSINRKSEP